MTQPILDDETKEDNFNAVAPKWQGPILVSTKTDKKNGISFFGSLFFILFLAASGSAWWFYTKAQDFKIENESLKQEASQAVEPAENLSTLEKLNRHIILPQSQQPEVVSIDNVSQLKSSDPFFEYAQNGDLLVKFTNLEIIYNLAGDVIVNARTRNTGQVAGTEARATQDAITLDIRNGAGVAGLAGKTAQTFVGVKEYVVKNVGNAATSNNSKTILVSLTTKDISGLEKQFGVTAVKVLPQGEPSSTADVVVIVGKQ